MVRIQPLVDKYVHGRVATFFWYQETRLRRLLMAGVASLVLSACDGDDPACNNINGADFPSPDGNHIARIYETFCGAFGGASDGNIVAVRERGDIPERQSKVFLVFDQVPKVRWLDEKNLVVEVSSVTDITLSKHSAKGVTVHYSLSPTLAAGGIQKDLNAKQKWADKFIPKLREPMRANNERMFAAFVKWARENVDQ